MTNTTKEKIYWLKAKIQELETLFETNISKVKNKEMFIKIIDNMILRLQELQDDLINGGNNNE